MVLPDEGFHYPDIRQGFLNPGIQTIQSPLHLPKAWECGL